MIWVFLSFFSALFESIKDVFCKKSLKNLDAYFVAWAMAFFGLPFLIVFSFFYGFPELGDKFWPALIISGILNAISFVLYMKAIKCSDLSITVPMIAFSPLFLLITSPIMIGEFPNSMGLIGVVLIVVGSYILNIKERNRGGYFSPFVALFKETGPRLMMLVAVIWSITANIDKIGIRNSSPIFWGAADYIFISLIMMPAILYRFKQSKENIRANYKILFMTGFFWSLIIIFQMIAINMAPVIYVAAIKRTSIIMSVLFGGLLFQEKNIKERLAGSIAMISGVVFIILS